MAKTFSYPSMWVSIISILTVVGEWNPFGYCDKNQGKLCSPNFLYYMHNLFDLWMSHVGYGTFVMVVSFINNFWEPTHVTVRVFEVQNIIDGTIENQVKILLDSFGLLDKVIIYIKNETQIWTHWPMLWSM